MSKGYQNIPLTINRRILRASASITNQKNTIHSLADVDITEPRRRIREHYEETGEKLSFTAYIVNCLAQTLKDFPEFNSFVKGNRLIILDDVTISVLIERTLKGERIPEPLGIGESQKKSYYQIHKEIREAQKMTNKTLGSFSDLTWIRFIPVFLMKSFIRLADRNIKMAKKYGKVAVTAVGMYSKEPIWFIPHGSPTVLITLGSMSNKVMEEYGQLVTREHLCLTASFDHDIVDGAPASRFIEQFLLRIKSGKDL